MNNILFLNLIFINIIQNIDLSQLGLSRSLGNLMELKITYCEGLTPRKFRNLPHLQYLTLM